MNITQVIAELQKLREQYGDLEVEYLNDEFKTSSTINKISYELNRHYRYILIGSED